MLEIDGGSWYKKNNDVFKESKAKDMMEEDTSWRNEDVKIC